MRKICKTLFILFVGVTAKADITGQVFDTSADPAKDQPLFTMKHDTKVDGDKVHFHVAYSGSDGKEVLVEDVDLHGATEVLSYHLDHKQIGAKASVEVKDGRVYFTYQKKDASEKKSDEKKTDNLVVGPSLTSYIRKHFDEIKDGKRVSIRFVVPDRLETVGFDLLKDKRSTDDKIVVKMKASSLVISAIVDPLYLTFPADGGRMIEMQGRSPVKIERAGKFRDLDAHTIYKTE